MNNLISKLFNKYFWSNLWYTQVSSRLNPRQKWLTKKIPRTWMDADDLVELCIFEILIFWWTKDDGEEMTRFQYTSEEDPALKEAAKRTYDRLKAAYEWASHGRKAAIIEAERTIEGMDSKNYVVEDLQKYSELMNAIETQETFYLNEIVDLRKYMWT